MATLRQAFGLKTGKKKVKSASVGKKVFKRKTTAHRSYAPVVLVPASYMTGKSSRAWDKMFRALKPGKRKSSKGKVYYEHRRNRSDLHPAQHL